MEKENFDQIDEYSLTTKSVPDYTTFIFYKDSSSKTEVLLTNKNEPPSFLISSFDVSFKDFVSFHIDFLQLINYVKDRIFMNAKIIDYVPIRLIDSSLFIAVYLKEFKLKNNIPLTGKKFSSIDVFFENWMKTLKKQIENTKGITLALI